MAALFLIRWQSSFRYNHSLRVVRSPVGSNMGKDTGKPDMDIEEHRGKAALHQQAPSLWQMEVVEEESALQLAFSSFLATAV